MLRAAVLVATLAAVWAQQDLPPKCCFDKQFSAVLSDTGGFFGSSNTQDLTLFDAGSVTAYDFYSQQQAIGPFALGNNEYNSTVEIFELRDWRHNILYRKVGRYGNCTQQPLRTGRMPPPCIPGNATLVSNSTLGYGRSKLDVQIYEFDVQHSQELDNGRMKP